MSKSIQKLILLIILIVTMLGIAHGQEKDRIALISIDARNLDYDNTTMANILRLELEKVEKFEVLDKYDVSNAMEANNIDPDKSFGKNSQVETGKLLNAEKMLTGSAELFGDKIIIILRLIDVKSKSVEQTSVMEYLNAQQEIQTMCMISINDLLGIETDQHLVDLLINYNLPITTKRTTVRLNGPRMGALHMMGDNGRRLTDPKSNGGYNMFPVTSMFGYQFEKQYMSSGNFQALVEVIPAVSGLESGTIIPSISFLNGFRFNDKGYEFALGPIVRVLRTEEGYYEDDQWIRVSDVSEVPSGVEISDLIDSRGNIRGSVGMVIAIGKTFRSGYLNIPVNLYYSPIKNGSIVGVTIGFNTTKKPSF